MHVRCYEKTLQKLRQIDFHAVVLQVESKQNIISTVSISFGYSSRQRKKSRTTRMFMFIILF